MSDRAGPLTFGDVGKRVGDIVTAKNREYGDAYKDCADFMKILYPVGVSPSDYMNLLALARIFDKMKRIATSPKTAAEDSWLDIAGYGVLMTAVHSKGSVQQKLNPPVTVNQPGEDIFLSLAEAVGLKGQFQHKQDDDCHDSTGQANNPDSVNWHGKPVSRIKRRRHEGNGEGQSGEGSRSVRPM